jgi:hypothetical protein
MTAQVPIVHNAAANTHEPLPGADTLSLTAAQVTDLRAQLGLPDDNQAASEVSVSPAILGETNVQDALAAAAASITGLPATITAAIAAQVPAIVDANEARLRHPFECQWSTLESATTVGFWPAGLAKRTDADQVLAFANMGSGHTTEVGQIIMGRSYDWLASVAEWVTIFSRESDPYVRGTAIGNMASGRIGGIITTGDTTRKQWFSRSDDGGATFTETDITAQVPDTNHHVYGQLLPWPAAAGGHDSLGFIVATYAGTADAKYMGTQDNGATWTDGVLKSATGLPFGTQAQEPILLKTSAGWVLFARTNANTNLVAAVAGPDMVFGAWIDTGFPQGSNPVTAVVDSGYISVIVQDRRSFPGSVSDNATRMRRIPETASPATLADAEETVVAIFPDRGIGYVQSILTEVGWLHLAKGGEGASTIGGSGARLLVGRTTPAAVDDPVEVVNIIENGEFAEWPRGDSFLARAAGFGCAGRWSVNVSGATVDVEKLTITKEELAGVPCRTPYGLTIDNVGDADDFVTLRQRWLGTDAQALAALLMERQAFTVRLVGKGVPPADLFFSVAAGSTEIGYAAFTRPQGIEGDAPWVSTGVLKLTDLATDPASVATLDFSVGNRAVNSEYTLRLLSVAGYLGSGRAAPLEPPVVPPAVTAAQVARYCEKMTLTASDQLVTGVAVSTTTIYAPLRFTPKVSNALTITSSTASDFAARNSGLLTPSAIAFSTASQFSARMALTVTGATSGGAYVVEVAASPGADPFVLIDTGY